MNIYKYLLYPLPFYTAKLIDPFLNSRISANHDKINEQLYYFKQGLDLWSKKILHILNYNRH